MIVLAFGMSSPFSTMVVASSTSYLCATKSTITRSSSSSLIWPWPTATFASGTSRVTRFAHRVDRLDAVVDEEHLAAALDLGANRARDDVGIELARPASEWTGGRAAASRSPTCRECPTSDMFSVRGIGVAVIVSTSTFLRSCLIRSLCATPNRCSSSTTSRPRSRKATSFDSSRCVPTMMSTWPDGELPTRSPSAPASCRKRLIMSIRTGNPANRSLERSQVLERQHGRRREKGDLLAVDDGLERRAHRDFGLAVADIAAEQPIHRRRRFHVARDVGDRGLLVRRQVVLERVVELLLPVRVGAERMAGHGLARRVELQQLLGHVAHGLLDARLGFFPGRAAELVERRRRAAGVLLDQIEPLERDEQLVLAGVAELHELLLRLPAPDQRRASSGRRTGRCRCRRGRRDRRP